MKNLESTEKLNRYGYIRGFASWIDGRVEIMGNARSKLFVEGDEMLHL